MMYSDHPDLILVCYKNHWLVWDIHPGDTDDGAMEQAERSCQEDMGKNAASAVCVVGTNWNSVPLSATENIEFLFKQYCKISVCSAEGWDMPRFV